MSTEDPQVEKPVEIRQRHRETLVAVIVAAVVACVAAVSLIVAQEFGAVPQANAPGDATATAVSADSDAEFGEAGAGDAESLPAGSQDAPELSSQAPVTEAVAPEQPVETQPVTVTIAAVGDVLMHRGVWESGETGDGYDFTHLFGHVRDEMATCDVRIANQETPIAGAAFGYSGYPSFNAPFEVADGEAASGINLVTKATNHAFDQGYAGIREELSLWGQRHPEVAVVGAADPDGNGICPAGGCSPAGPYIFEKDGFRVAFVNYTEVLNANIDPERDPSVLSIASDERVTEDVRWAREVGHADAIVALMHWGEEYEEVPVDSERHWADLLLSLGVDAVIGGHPHVVQPVEEMTREDGHRMVVFWSVGNFVSTQINNRNMMGILAKVALTKDASGVRVSAYEAIPTVTHRASGTDFTTYMLRDYTEELAAANQIHTVEPVPMTLGWCQDYCSRVLGEAYDRGACSIHWAEPLVQ